MGDLTEHFSYKEFKCPCPDCNCDGIKINKESVEALEIVRSVYGKPIRVSSGVRCKAHNEAVGGKPDSEHLYGDGIDIRIRHSSERYALLSLLTLHFSRIGIGSDFIHLGSSTSKVQNVVWVYS